MNKNRMSGAAHEAKGAVKEAVGKLTGNTRLNIEGKAEKWAGKTEAAVGKARDSQKKR